MVANTSMYGFNPYMMSQNAGFYDDFMANATGFNNQYAQLAQQQALAQQLSLSQPVADTFQKSEGGSRLKSGLKLAAVGGVGAGAGAYFLGDKLGAAITLDGKTFSDDILKAYQTDPIELAKTNSMSKLILEKENRVKVEGFTSMKEYEAVKQYVQTPAANRAALPKEITDLVPDAVKNNPDVPDLKNRLAEQLYLLKE